MVFVWVLLVVGDSGFKFLLMFIKMVDMYLIRRYFNLFCYL